MKILTLRTQLEKGVSYFLEVAFGGGKESQAFRVESRRNRVCMDCDCTVLWEEERGAPS